MPCILNLPQRKHLQIMQCILSTWKRELAAYQVNVLDISQTVMQGYFTMMMAVDVSACNVPLAQLCQSMDAKGQEMNLSIRVQREDIFEAMHRI